MKTTFLSRWEFKAKAVPVLNPKTHAVISFNDTPREVDDMRNTIPSEVKSFICLVKDDNKDFSIETAKLIKDFVEGNKEKHFVIHCFAGISRSAAVARWIELHLNNKLPPRLENYAPYNKHIFDRLEALCT